METKINLQKLSAMLAITSGKQKKLCEDFLREFFKVVSEELERGEGIRIKGFGTFKISSVEARRSVDVSTGENMEIPGHKRVVFVASKELADAVNVPFSSFETVEISDEVDTDFLLGDETENIDIETLYESADPGNVAEPREAPDCENEQGLERDVETEEESGTGPEGNSQVVPEGEYVPQPDYEDEEPERTHRFAWGFLSGTGCMVALAMIGWGVYERGWIPGAGIAGQVAGEVENIAEITVDKVVVDTVVVGTGKPSDSLETAAGSVEIEEMDVATEPSDNEVYDTVTTTRYLTTIARDHYGNFNLWPVIYEENEAILGHPDRIRPGTKVRVPALSKYGVDPRNKGDVAKIKQRGLDIYAKFKK